MRLTPTTPFAGTTSRPGLFPCSTLPKRNKSLRVTPMPWRANHGRPYNIIRHTPKPQSVDRNTAETLRIMLRSSPASPVKPQQWTVCRSGAAVVASPPPVVAVAPRTVASAPLRALTTESAETHPVPEVRCLLLDSTSKHAQLQLCSLTSAGIIVRGSLRHCSPTTMRRRCSPATSRSTSCSQ